MTADAAEPAARARVGDRLPEWMRTVRFRLAVTYSSLLFALATLVLAAIYLGVRYRLASEPITQTVVVRRGFFAPDGHFVPLPGFEIADVRSIEEAAAAQTLRALTTYSLWALLGLFLVSLLIGWWVSGRALRPVAAITETARRISVTDLSRRIPLQGPDDELRRLADTLNEMLGRLDSAFSAQRAILDDATHELKTPLAIIRSNVDAVLADDAAAPQDRARSVEVVARATDRMARLVDDLLATARRGTDRFVETGLDLSEVAREAAEEARALAPALIVRSGLVDGLRVSGDRDALRRAVTNLLSNAVRYTPEGGEVLCACGRLGGWGWVAVRDQGPGLAPEAQQRVFDRFYRVEGHGSAFARGASGQGSSGAGAFGQGSSGAGAFGQGASGQGRSREGTSGHAGLGLAIVRQIVEGHGGKVAVHSDLGHGATFVLWLPLTGAGEELPAPVDTDPLPIAEANRGQHRRS